jgi:hypothetical protein
MVFQRAFHLLERAIGRKPRTGQRCGVFGWDISDLMKIFRMRHPDLRGITAIDMHAEKLRFHAQLLLARGTDSAGATADPGIDHIFLSPVERADIRASGDHFPDRFMPHHQRQRDPALGEFQLAAVTKIIPPLANMQVGVTDAGGGHGQDDLRSARGHVRPVVWTQGLTEFMNTLAMHDVFLRYSSPMM